MQQAPSPSLLKIPLTRSAGIHAKLNLAFPSNHANTNDRPDPLSYKQSPSIVQYYLLHVLAKIYIYHHLNL